jgi:DNA-binding transcriptional ArsR family regulator
MAQPEPTAIDANILKALNHELRRKILIELYEFGLAGYSELARILELKPGVFYHHIRILENAELVKQDRDKIYEITERGFRALEFLKTDFVPSEQSQVISWLTYYKVISKRINSFSIFFAALEILIIGMGLGWLAIDSQLVFFGYFIFYLNNATLALIYSILFTGGGLILHYMIFQFSIRRSVQRIELLANIMLPQAIIIVVIMILNFFPDLIVDITLSNLLGILITVFFQLFSLSYLLHVFQRAGARSFDRLVILLLILQYSNLMVLYILT